MRWYFLWGLLLFSSVSATEFLYPVCVDKSGLFYLIYQKTSNHIELWQWNPTTKHIQQLLFSRFTPAGFRLLPDEDGFSFIDNGLLKVKKFAKRSPRTIEFDAPIYHVEIVNWLDNTSCYASGKYKNSFGIFQISYEGEVIPLFFQENVDCLYPQKYKNILFYIERGEHTYRIMHTKYRPAWGDTFKERLARHRESDPEVFEVISFARQPIVFLKMVSETEGFVVGHPPTVSRLEKKIPFDYYHFQKNGDDWVVNRLFSFHIPSDLLFIGSPLRLYESILPLIPQHYGQKIFFLSGNNLQDQSLFFYNCQTGKISALREAEQLFPPVGGFCGGVLGMRVWMDFVMGEMAGLLKV